MQPAPQPKKTPPTHRAGNVIVSVLVFYVVVLMFDAKGIYNWTAKLPISTVASSLKTAANNHWRKTAALGLEEPKYTLETLFLDAQEAHPLLYPKKYAVLTAKRKPKTLAKQPVIVRELLEPDELPADAKGPKVLVLGDSIMITVGPVIKKDIASQLDGAAVVKAKLATGLARPDVFDWVKELKRMTADHHYDFAVLMLGTNDSQDFAEDGQILTYGTSGWVKAYNHRLDQLMTETCKAAAKGLWIGLPPMRSEAFNRKAVRINSWAEKQVERHPCMQYVSSDKVVGDKKGRYTSYLKIDDHMEKVRMVDGIHVTARGGSLISAALLDLMSAAPPALAH